jgi:putative Holliday junction resolvase
MIFDDIATLCSSLNRHERLFGLDLGEKTIGIAVSDPGLHVATPVVTIRRKKFTLDAQELLRLIAEQFASNLLKLKDLPVAFWDERLSTVAVTRDMIEADLSRAKRAQAVDRAAATFILQGALDFWQKQKAAI